MLGNLFHASMEIPDHALRTNHAFAIQLQFDAQHAMGRRMLRAHVNDELIGAKERVLFLCCLVVQSVSQVFETLLT
jgi:hypothetical protein